MKIISSTIILLFLINAIIILSYRYKFNAKFFYFPVKLNNTYTVTPGTFGGIKNFFL